MIAQMLAAAAVASAPLAPPHSAPKDPTPAELKAENAKLQARATYLAGLVQALQAQRDQNANQAADAAARFGAVQQGGGQQ